VHLPETRSYRIKKRLLGKPMANERLQHERLGKPTALAIFASDNLSSSAYATEEILHVLIPVIGIFAFSLVLPLTGAMLIVLFFLILSYRETIKEYPSAGGAYVVTRDNFGKRVAKVAGVSLLTDYILTAAVSVSAGTAALASAFDVFDPYRVEIAIGFILIVAFLNMRGVKESGSIFRIPTYFFVFMVFSMLLIGGYRWAFGDLPTAEHAGSLLEKYGEFGEEGKLGPLLYGAALFKVLHAFASGGAAVTGVEAISNGVPAFRKPEWKNARQTLVIMGALLGTMFFGISALAAHLQVSPFDGGTPTVISQIGRLVFGGGLSGDIGFFALQAGTMFILVLAANTAYADFPRLGAFMAEDGFAPRQLIRRGHRLVYSNGIILLSVCAIILVIATGAQVTKLIPLYAIGVFLGFTLSQAGMVKHHHHKRQEHWKRSMVVNGFGCGLSAVVCVVIAVTKFWDGAWVILVALPVLVTVIDRLNRQYQKEDSTLADEVLTASAAKVLRRHLVLVFINRIDASTARAIQYARTLAPDELRAVHIAADPEHAQKLAEKWSTLTLSRIPLELIECTDRRTTRASLEYIVGETADQQTEVTVVMPQRVYRRFWHKLIHDRTADRLSDVLGVLPHVNVTLIPFHVSSSAANTVTVNRVKSSQD
jgi:amino acid transporter